MINGFIIPTFCDSQIHFEQLIRCVSSIRKYFETEQITLIDDFSSIDIKEIKNLFNNIEIVKSIVRGAGDMVTYTVLLESNLDKVCIIQDSMILEDKIDFDSVKDIAFIWYFTNHRLHCHSIMEEISDYNIKNNIVTHDDLNLHYISKIEKEDFREYCLNKYNKKNEWSGCFGCLSIVTKEFAEQLNIRTGIIDFLKQMNTNRLRRSAESIFTLACYFIKEDLFETAYDGLYYDGYNNQNGHMIATADYFGFNNTDILVTQVCKNKYFSKLAFRRRE